MEKKTCTACLAEKPISDFAKGDRYLYGRKSICRNCVAEKDAKWYSKNKQEILQKSKIRNLGSTPQSRAKKRSTSSAWKARNRDIVNAQRRLAYHQDREKILERGTTWRRSNPEVVAAMYRNKKARRRSAPGTHTASDVKEIWERQNHRCAVPNCPHPISEAGENKYHVDHVEPLARGGSNDRYNLQILCGTHNMQKNSACPYEWAQRNGLLFL
jgi:HNH endonuclease